MRNDGYTIAVILETLEAQGVSASWSTVQREAKKLESASLAVPLVNVKRTAPSLPPTPNVSPVKPAQASDLDTFFQPGFDNPLFRKKKL